MVIPMTAGSFALRCPSCINLFDIPLCNLDLIFYVDVFCFWGPNGKFVFGYVVCSQFDVVESRALLGVHCAQISELIALTAACH